MEQDVSALKGPSSVAKIQNNSGITKLDLFVSLQLKKALLEPKHLAPFEQVYRVIHGQKSFPW